MKEKIAECVYELFANSETNVATVEIREELVFNLCEKYDDLLREGYSENSAFYKVVSGIGDINELIGSVNKSNSYDETQSKYEAEQIRHERAAHNFKLSIGILFCILCPVPVIVSGMFFSEIISVIGIVFLFIMVAIGVVFIINASSALDDLKPKKKKVKYQTDFNGNMNYSQNPNINTEDIPVNNFSNDSEESEDQEMNQNYGYEHQHHHHNEKSDTAFLSPKSKKLFGIAQSIMWIFITIFFFLISNVFGFKFTWLIFVCGAAFSQLLLIMFYYYDMQQAEYMGMYVNYGVLKRHIKNIAMGLFWTVVTILYFGISFVFGFRWTWIIFVLATGVMQIINLLFTLNEGQ